MAEKRGTQPTVCVAIPTYQREQVLVNTVKQVLAQDPPADEILVVDQTPDHEPSTLAALKGWHEEGKIRWIKHSPPNSPGAWNRALIEAQSDIVIFIDDDVILAPGFVGAHRRSYDDPRVDLVAGQVLNKDRQVHSGAVKDYELEFPLNRDERTWIRTMRGCNCSVRRRLALDLGGLDQQYFHGASRFEPDFAIRAIARTGRAVFFEPAASLVHLAEPTGGARTWGTQLGVLAAGWGAGDYYFALKNLPPARMIRHVVKGSFHRVINRYSVGHPWAIPLFLIREAVSLICAAVFAVQGRKLISLPASHSRIVKQES